VKVDIHHAKAHLSTLIAAAENGAEVSIARAGKPVVELVPVMARVSNLRASRDRA
jgi:prevent-host-death family protein